MRSLLEQADELRDLIDEDIADGGPGLVKCPGCGGGFFWSVASNLQACPGCAAMATYPMERCQCGKAARYGGRCWSHRQTVSAHVCGAADCEECLRDVPF